MNALTSFVRLAAVAALSSSTLVACSGASTEEESGDDEGAIVAAQPFFCPTAAKPDYSQPAASNKPAILVAARAAGHPELGIDRFVLEFSANGAAPAFDVWSQNDATFSGTAEESFKLLGTRGLGVSVHGASAGWPIVDPAPVYKGATDIKPGDTTKLKEALYIEDFEADLYWGIGTAGAACFRAFRLTNPPRLVVDIKR